MTGSTSFITWGQETLRLEDPCLGTEERRLAGKSLGNHWKIPELNIFHGGCNGKMATWMGTSSTIWGFSSKPRLMTGGYIFFYSWFWEDILANGLWDISQEIQGAVQITGIGTCRNKENMYFPFIVVFPLKMVISSHFFCDFPKAPLRWPHLLCKALLDDSASISPPGHQGYHEVTRNLFHKKEASADTHLGTTDLWNSE